MFSVDLQEQESLKRGLKGEAGFAVLSCISARTCKDNARDSLHANPGL